MKSPIEKIAYLNLIAAFVATASLVGSVIRNDFWFCLMWFGILTFNIIAVFLSTADKMQKEALDGCGNA